MFIYLLSISCNGTSKTKAKSDSVDPRKELQCKARALQK